MQTLGRWFKPTALGIVLLLPLVAIQLFFITYSGTIRPGESPVVGWSVGLPFPVISSSSEAGVTAHPAGLLSILVTWLVAMRVGAIMASSRAWSVNARVVPRGALVVLSLSALVALVAAAAFSTHYWGYPWRRPALPAGVECVQWTHSTGFRSDETGRRWTIDPELRLEEAEPTDDSECCRIRRIVELARSRGPMELREVPPEILSRLEEQFAALVVLDEGEPGYPYARQLRGIVLVGVDPTRGPVAFASYSTLEHRNDHDALGEVWWTTEPAALLSSSRVFADVAGIEGLTAPVAFWVLFIVLAFVVSPVLAISFLLVRGTSRWLGSSAERS